MSLLQETKLLLRNHRIIPNKNLGQNFTIEPWIFDRMVNYGSVNSKDTVLDIGAGLGFLTRILAERCKTVFAVEAQSELVKVLSANLADLPNVTILKGNILTLAVPQFDKAISIPPFGLSSRLLLWLFEHTFDRAVLIFQDEFASRLAARVGTKSYGWLSVLTCYHLQTELLDEVVASCFYPPPKVNSIIVRFNPRKHPPFKVKDEKSFTQLTRSLFTQRNKKVRKAAAPFLRSYGGLPKGRATELANKLPFSEKRVRELAPEDFGVLANVIDQEKSIL